MRHADALLCASRLLPHSRCRLLRHRLLGPGGVAVIPCCRGGVVCHEKLAHTQQLSVSVRELLRTLDSLLAPVVGGFRLLGHLRAVCLQWQLRSVP